MTEVRILTSHLGWILEAFARESADACGEEIRLVPIPVRRREYMNPNRWSLMRTPNFSRDRVLFLHHETLLRNKKDLLGRDVRLLLTHFEDGNRIDPALLLKLDQVSRVVVQNKSMSGLLIKNGISPAKIRVGFGAVDRETYFPLRKRTSQEFILVVGDCKPRKNPELISQVILRNPHRKFVIHGLHWDKYLSNKVLNSPNMEVINFSKANNPSLMRQATLLLSLSLNEGGPIPVLEALASGTPVLATDTGFCKDVIPTECGTVIPIHSDVEAVSIALNQIWHKKNECWSEDLLDGRFSWNELGKLLYGN